MAKIRVYELARELKMDSKALLAKLKVLKIEVASHQNTLTDAEVALIRKGAGVADGEDGALKPKVVVRRRKKAAPVVEAAPEVEEVPIVEAKASVEDESAPIAEETISTVEVAKSDENIESVVATPAVETKEEVKLSSSSKDEPKEAEKKVASRKSKFQGGATIVRKVTPEEIERQKAARQQKSRPATNSFSSSRGSSSSSQPAFSSDPSTETVQNSFRSPAHGRDAYKKKTETISEEEARKLKLRSKNRRSQSTRDLLANIGNETVTPTNTFNRPRRKTVYTPSAANRKRDLKRRKDLKSTEITTPRAAYRVVKMQEQITVGDFALQMSVKSGEVIKKLMDQGVMATINQTIDFDTATLIATDFSFEVKSEVKTVEDVLDLRNDNFEKFPRSPIVTIMGHVDHGKTSILDAIRESGVAAKEAGGITQHIGAYTVEKNGHRYAFLDTPGHEAFSAMRSRGASVTDIVILVVAADDGVMPQTVEAISHARNANVPIIVAINKIDKPNKNLDRVFSELSEHGIQSEEWGGENQFVETSALEKIGLDELLEAIHLQAEMLELKASPEARGEGAIVEAHMEKGFGPIATVMVTNGTLKKGDYVVAGACSGRIRAMTDDKGKKHHKVGPATPVRVVGMSEVPMAGDPIYVVENEKIAKEVSGLRKAEIAVLNSTKSSAQTLEDLLSKVQASDIPEVPLILKADTQGSVEAICETIAKLDTEGVKSRVIHKAVGGINESDISLAETSGAVILGFNVRAGFGLDEKAEKKGVVVNYFSIIYELVDAVKSVMSGKLPPIQTEVIQGHAEVRNPISVPKIGTIAGSSVTDGKITRNSHLRLIREEIVIYDGKIGSLRRFKDDVKEVLNGYECGIGIDGYNDIKIGDVIEAYIIEETAATL